METYSHTEERTFLTCSNISSNFCAIYTVHIANKNEEYERKWSDDLRLQAHHDHHAPRYDMDDADYKRDPRSIVLSVLQTLNSLNKFSHAWTKPVLGYSLTFHPNQWLLLPSKLPERDLYRGEFDLLRSFTRVYSRWMPTLTGGLRFVATVFPWPLQEWQGLFASFDLGSLARARKVHSEQCWSTSPASKNSREYRGLVFSEFHTNPFSGTWSLSCAHFLAYHQVRYLCNQGPTECGPRIALGAFAIA